MIKLDIIFQVAVKVIMVVYAITAHQVKKYIILF